MRNKKETLVSAEPAMTNPSGEVTRSTKLSLPVRPMPKNPTNNSHKASRRKTTTSRSSSAGAGKSSIGMGDKPVLVSHKVVEKKNGVKVMEITTVLFSGRVKTKRFTNFKDTGRGYR